MEAMDNMMFSRTEMLVGHVAMERLRATRIIVFGVGGVGSWCAEALVRSGVGHLTLVDPDCVDVTNINRQLPATTTTVGRPKVEVLRERFLEINPEADITARQERFEWGLYSSTAPGAVPLPYAGEELRMAAEKWSLDSYDYVIDAIDSIEDKINLILTATSCGRPTLLSSMGAARKTDPLQVRVSEFWKVDGCPLAAKIRKRMRKEQRFPERKFKCVWSPERNDEAEPKGTMMPVTATFGLTLASLVIKRTAN